MTRPVKLQINQRGGWRDVMRVDIDQLVDEADFLDGAATMVIKSGKMYSTSMRIVTDDSPPMRLMAWSAEGGWEKVTTP